MSKEMLTYLIVPGLKDSGPTHWQTAWQREQALPRVTQSDWHAPNIDTWATTLEHQVRRLRHRAVILAHSFGCLATVYAAEALQDRIAAALLVAPADPAKFDIAHRLPVTALPFPSLVVASTNDPWMEFSEARRWANQWDSQFVNLGPAGHINAESGYGPWSKGWSLVDVLVARIRRRPSRTNAIPVDSANDAPAWANERYAFGE